MSGRRNRSAPGRARRFVVLKLTRTGRISKKDQARPPAVGVEILGIDARVMKTPMGSEGVLLEDPYSIQPSFGNPVGRLQPELGFNLGAEVPGNSGRQARGPWGVSPADQAA